MSETDDHNELTGDELLAAEYALGVLGGSERVAAQARIDRDHAFAALVAAWESRLMPWATEIPDETPPSRVWDRIAGEIAPARPLRAPYWQSVTLWRGLAVAGFVAAACLGALLYFGTLAQPPLFATIQGGGERIFVATLDAGRRTIAVVPANYTATPDRVPELWLIPQGGRPLPLGLLRGDRAVTITISAAMADKATVGAALAISLEPPGGSPTGAPTGPVIGSGKLTSL